MEFIKANGELTAFTGSPEQADAIFGKNNWADVTATASQYTNPTIDAQGNITEAPVVAPEPTEIEKLTARVEALEKQVAKYNQDKETE